MARPQPSLPFAVALAWLTAAGPPLSAGTGLPDHLALALPVTGITVDGDLSDWPRDMPALPIRNEFGAYGATDTEGTDLGTSADLSPSFRVGYDPGRQLLHVAVEVRDDMLHATGFHAPDGRLRDLRLGPAGRGTPYDPVRPCAGIRDLPLLRQERRPPQPPERQEIARGLAAPGRSHHLRVEPAGAVLGADLSAERSLGDAPPSFQAGPPGRRHGDRVRRGRRRRRWATGGFPRPEAFAPARGLDGFLGPLGAPGDAQDDEGRAGRAARAGAGGLVGGVRRGCHGGLPGSLAQGPPGAVDLGDRESRGAPPLFRVGPNAEPDSRRRGCPGDRRRRARSVRGTGRSRTGPVRWRGRRTTG